MEGGDWGWVSVLGSGLTRVFIWAGLCLGLSNIIPMSTHGRKKVRPEQEQGVPELALKVSP